MIEITYKHLEKWKVNSIKVARKLDYNESVLSFLDDNVKFTINKSKRPNFMWYGQAHFDEKSPVIEIYNENLSCESVPKIVKNLKEKGNPGIIIFLVGIMLEITPRELFFNIYNQCGMDHELIGHIYNWFSKKEYDERAAVKVNLEFINAKCGFSFLKLPWNVFSFFAPILLFYHKKDEF